MFAYFLLFYIDFPLLFMQISFFHALSLGYDTVCIFHLLHHVQYI